MSRGKKGCFLAVMVFLLGMGIFAGEMEFLQAQPKYPTKPIELIVPFPPGGGSDTAARVMTDFLSRRWGVSVNVVNKPGGNCIPAILELYHAKPDGYTIMFDGMATSSQLTAVVQDPPFKIMDRTFMGIIVAFPYFYMVQFDSPMKTMKDVEAEAKKDPGNFTWTSQGPSVTTDFAVKKFMKVIGVDVVKTKPVPCKGGSEAVTHITSGLVKLGISSPAAAGPAIASKLVRALTVTTSKRLQNYPDVPTIEESGYPAATKYDHWGPSGPPNLPSHIVEAWDKALAEMQKDPEVISKFTRLGQQAFYHNPRATRELVLKEMEEVKDIMMLK